MEIKISEQGPNNRGKTGERTIPVRVGMPLMKQFQEESMKSFDDPVFKKGDAKRLCPKPLYNRKNPGKFLPSITRVQN